MGVVKVLGALGRALGGTWNFKFTFPFQLCPLLVPHIVRT